MRLFWIGLAIVAGSTVVWGQQPAAKCTALTGVTLDHAKVVQAELAQPSSLEALKVHDAATLPAFCRVQIEDRPSGDSRIHTEVWLPMTGWNGRLRAQGNGGFAGTIYYDAMAETVRQSYATVGTDTGHTGGTPDFALGHPEKVKDFGWRAVHDMTVQAKAVIAAFYGRPQQKAYFTSCSDGGREALMEAQRFPGDYDGILAGAPAYNWTGLMVGAAEIAQWMSAAEANFLPASKIPALARAVNAACDAKDGVRDGIINDPRTCNFDPATIACKAGDDDDCLLPAQVETVKRIYRGPVNDSGKVVLKGLEPGAEDGPQGWSHWLSGHDAGSNMSFFGEGFFSNFVTDDPGWKAASFSFDRDYRAAREKTAMALNATETNLEPFALRGGKLLMYHGWNDPAIPATMSISYYEDAARQLGAATTASTLRLYLVPGMQHCGFGPGATEFGQGMAPRGDAEHDIFTALEQWTEKGTAPSTLTAVKAEGKGADRKVVMTRPLCPYPQIAKYNGNGDSNQASSFTCSLAR
ncbi:MAG: tannase/feruloyl esterase family alpha/beta hydrolase [Edaphobacter sp.]|uniref:tannase/feruloyl esterase family alpha/beta hydrolase n=1 Tax=Edaphobacter sp. TaxID=1934404 RepID=UPI00239E1CCE|nr:tannase/feruloyl esterase family alpha/beta hydrolase [Edaphobacter sp.]MDE1178151.1 tannase/feruloyl esterase family alpha/beta hydrolase [Edaphobacter sp.]